jgi:cyclic-di-AMP phosphodiesterase PgpH
MKRMSGRNKIKRNPNLFAHIAISLITCLIVVVIIQWDRGLFKAEFREGDISLRDIYAPYDFSFEGEINVKATETAREAAVVSELPVYSFKADVQNNVLKKADSVINALRSLRNKQPAPTDEEKSLKIKEISGTYGITEQTLIDLLEIKDYNGFLAYLKTITEKYFPEGIIPVLEKKRLEDNNVNTVNIRDDVNEGRRKLSVKNFFTPEDLKKEIDFFSANNIRDKKEKKVFPDFMNALMAVNVIFDKTETEYRKQSAALEAQPVYDVISVKKNEIILNKGERIGKEHLMKMEALEKNESSVIKMGNVVAIVILVGLFMLLLALYIEVYEPQFAAGNKELSLLSLICILLLMSAKIIVMSPWPSSLIPLAVASMLIAILIDSRLAIVTTCFLSVLVGMISGNRLDIAGMSLVGGIIGIIAMKGVRRRSQVLAGGLCVGLANMSYLIGIGLIQSLDFNTYMTESLFGLGNGIMSAIIVTGILPLFENSFKITTDISLLELADLNHPLLKEMVMKAPGTYHHSLVVGNLAEAACESIGANALLARVSSYFHDIGKIEKSLYFSENQYGSDSVHDKLSPTMSSLVITNHVKNGVELAQKYKLNKKIIDVIKQHHGSSLVFYFFKRALEKGKDEDIEEEGFRYPGPKPQTREAACVLLADSVEAASRALDDPTPSRIKGLVRKIINNKFIDGQLDECDLSLRDLEKIAEVFTHILTGIFHTRIEYPDEPAKREK